MSECFILGAGFSRAVGGTVMPLTSDLTDSIVPGFMQDLVGYQHFLIDGQLPIQEVEAWLSSLAEPQPYRDRADNLQAQALFFEIVRLLAFDLRSRTNDVLAVQDSPPEWLVALMHQWHRREVTVITFNYDTLVESTLPALDLKVEEAKQEVLTYKRLPPGFVPFWEMMYGGLRLRPTRTFHFLKLHGSLNWYWDAEGIQSPVDVGIYERWGQNKMADESELRFRAPGREPFLVPPTSGKSPYLSQPILREIWHQAHKALEKASTIFALGYSFPIADLSSRTMLAHSVRDKNITVVNRSVEAADNLRRLMLNAKIDTTFCDSDDSIQNFATEYGKGACW